MSEHHAGVLVEKSNGISGYPWEFMGRTYLLPRELGPGDDSLRCDGFYFAQFEPTDDFCGG